MLITLHAWSQEPCQRMKRQEQCQCLRENKSCAAAVNRDGWKVELCTLEAARLNYSAQVWLNEPLGLTNWRVPVHLWRVCEGFVLNWEGIKGHQHNIKISQPIDMLIWMVTGECMEQFTDNFDQADVFSVHTGNGHWPLHEPGVPCAPLSLSCFLCSFWGPWVL